MHEAALRLELNRKLLQLDSLSGIDTLLESYTEESIEDNESVYLNETGLFELFQLTNSNLPFNMVGPSGPLIFNASTNERNQQWENWGIGVEENEGEE